MIQLPQHPVKVLTNDGDTAYIQAGHEGKIITVAYHRDRSSNADGSPMTQKDFLRKLPPGGELTLDIEFPNSEK